jgi:prefoldin subunit 5
LALVWRQKGERQILPSEGSEILRVAVLSGVIGFAGFCISYGLYVWRRRNSGNRRFKSRAMTLVQLLAFLGGAAIAVSWAFNEFQGRSGIAGGSDVFVVNARRESFAQQITSADTVAQGDVVAEFLSPADRTRLAAIDLQVSQAKAKKDAIANKVLQSDEALLQEQTHLRSELLQDKGFAFQLQRSRYEVEREQATLTTAWTREESKLLEDLAAVEREFASALGHREITKRALQRGEELQKQGNLSRQQVDMRTSDDLSAELNVEKNKQAIASLKERRAALKRRFESSFASLDRQISELATDYARMAATIEELEERIDNIRHELRADHDRAIVSRQHEVDAVDYDITILAAEKTRLTEIGQVRAPFAGKVVYRHPAPGLASGNSPVLAISAGTGFTAAIRLPRSELRELASQTDPIKLALDSPVPNQFFTGRFVRFEPVPFEPARVIAYFDCDLPPEIIGYLGNTADPLRVRLLWRPFALFQPGIQSGILLLAASGLSLAAAIRGLLRHPRYLPNGERGMQATGIRKSERVKVPREAGSRASKPAPRESIHLLSLAARRDLHDQPR